MEFARSTSLLDIPPFVIKLPASTKKAIAIKDVDSRPPKILCGITAVVIAMSGLKRMVPIVAAPRAMDTGTPRIKNTAKLPNKIIPVMLFPPYGFLINVLPLMLPLPTAPE